MNFSPTDLGARCVAAARRHIGKLAVVFGVGWIAALAVSCATTSSRSVVMPPAVSGATYVGSDACEQCHDQIAKDFPTSSHFRLTAAGSNAMNVGCEICHGPASAHVESGGAARTLVHPDRNPEACFQCHTHIRGQFALPNRHPVSDGHFGCGTCHEPHKGDAHRAGGTGLLAENELCLKCHQNQRGPHIFEHEAMREGCTTCHQPHGSVNRKLLTERNAILCLKCHFQQQSTGGRVAIGAIDHTSFLSRGTCWSAGCHEAVHGSQISSSLRF